MKGEFVVSIFNEIKQGLQEAIDYERGNVKAKITVRSVEPIARFDPSDIRQIRNNTGLTQKMFAKYMGVSVKTIEAWESGRNHPDGAACRLLSITKNNPMFPEQSGIITI